MMCCACNGSCNHTGPHMFCAAHGGTASFVSVSSSTCTSLSTALCPDLLNINDIGEADGWRGKVVRAFFRALRWVTGL